MPGLGEARKKTRIPLQVLIARHAATRQFWSGGTQKDGSLLPKGLFHHSTLIKKQTVQDWVPSLLVDQGVASTRGYERNHRLST